MNKKSLQVEDPGLSKLKSKTRLIIAAADCFSELGFEGTSTREIATRAGAAQQLISYHFGTKEDLWKATFEHLQTRYMENASALHFNKNRNLKKQLREHICRLLSSRVNNPQLLKISTQEYLARSSRYFDIILPLQENFHKTVVAPYLKEITELGIIPEYSAGEFAIVQAGLMEINVLHPLVIEKNIGVSPSDPKTIETQADLLVKIFTSGNSKPSTDFNFQRMSELEDLVVEMSLEIRRLKSRLKDHRKIEE